MAGDHAARYPEIHEERSARQCCAELRAGFTAASEPLQLCNFATTRNMAKHGDGS